MIDDKYPSKERVERGGYLVYAEGDPIPETDRDELIRQGYLEDETSAALTVNEVRQIESLTDGTVDDVVARIGNDPEVAAHVLAAEQATEKPRKGVIEHAEAVLAAATEPEA